MCWHSIHLTYIFRAQLISPEFQKPIDNLQQFMKTEFSLILQVHRRALRNLLAKELKILTSQDRLELVLNDKKDMDKMVVVDQCR